MVDVVGSVGGGPAKSFLGRNRLIVQQIIPQQAGDGSVWGMVALLIQAVLGVKGVLVEWVKQDFGFGSEQIIQAMLFADKSWITENNDRIFEVTGMYHLLAVSGLHIGLVSGFIGQLVAPFWRPLRLFTQVGLLICYVILVGMGASAVRAGLMFAIGLLLRKFLQIQVSTLRILVFAVSVLLFTNPWWLLNIGFQMSVVATGSIIGWSVYKKYLLTKTHRAINVTSKSSSEQPGSQMSNLLLGFGLEPDEMVAELLATTPKNPLQSFYSIFRRYMLESFEIGLVVNLALWPVMWWHFGQVSWLGILVGPASLWLAPIIIYTFLCYLLVRAILPFAAMLPRLVVEVATQLLLFILSCFADVFSSIAIIEWLDFELQDAVTWYLGLLILIMLYGYFFQRRFRVIKVSQGIHA